MEPFATLAAYTLVALLTFPLALLLNWGLVRALLFFVHVHAHPRVSRPDRAPVVTRRTVSSAA